MAKAQQTTRPEIVVYELACPYCGTRTFTICPSILMGAIPPEVAHLVFRNVQCQSCSSTFSEHVMTRPERNQAQQALYLAANASQVQASATAGA